MVTLWAEALNFAVLLVGMFSAFFFADAKRSDADCRPFTNVDAIFLPFVVLGTPAFFSDDTAVSVCFTLRPRKLTTSDLACDEVGDASRTARTRCCRHRW